MNWEAISAVSEIVGAIAVVASVVYLAAQIKKQTEESRLSATRELADQYVDLLNSLIENDGLAEIYLVGVQDYESLAQGDRLKVALMFQKTARLMEQHFLHEEYGNVDGRYFVSTNNAFDEFLTFPGMHVWWENNKKHFESIFVAHVEKRLIAAKAKGYASTFNSKTSAPPNKAIESDA